MFCAYFSQLVSPVGIQHPSLLESGATSTAPSLAHTILKQEILQNIDIVYLDFQYDSEYPRTCRYKQLWPVIPSSKSFSSLNIADSEDAAQTSSVVIASQNVPSPAPSHYSAFYFILFFSIFPKINFLHFACERQCSEAPPTWNTLILLLQTQF